MKKWVYILIFVLTGFASLNAQRYSTSEQKEISNPGEKELAPVLYEDGIVFLSNILTPSSSRPIGPDGTPTLDLYYSKIKEDGGYEKAVLFDSLLVTDADEGAITFAQSNTMLCVAMQNGYMGLGLPDNGQHGLYFSFRRNGKWGELIPFEYNDPAMNYNTPFLTSDGMTLFFAADSMMEGSFGSWDIYVSRMEQGKWSKPENLGSSINSEEVEFFPFQHYSGRLYFSSNGHNSLGGSYDIFFSKNYDGKWLPAVRVPSINSFGDETSLLVNNELSEGYYSRKTPDGEFSLHKFTYPQYVPFPNPRPIQENWFCYRLFERTLDTVDYEIFYYEWVINDTLKIPGHEIEYCFPGPGMYHVVFNVTNKLTDTTRYNVADLDLDLSLIEQPVITVPDTLLVDQNVAFSADETNWDRWERGIEDFYWDFGNGVRAQGKNVRYQYPEPGNYTVVLGIRENRSREPEKAAVYKQITVLPRE